MTAASEVICRTICMSRTELHVKFRSSGAGLFPCITAGDPASALDESGSRGDAFRYETFVLMSGAVCYASAWLSNKTLRIRRMMRQGMHIAGMLPLDTSYLPRTIGKQPDATVFQ